MKTYHILNGDCLVDQLKQTSINQDFIICRECLVEGNLSPEHSMDFWTTRAKYIAETYNVTTEDYFSKTVSEFEKIHNLPENTEVCLWFENDLFCQTNMWFVLTLLANHPTLKIFRVFPKSEKNYETWEGFETATPENLEHAYNSKVEFRTDDIELGQKLWSAYQSGNFEKLKEISNSKSDCFEYLEEVCQAHINRFPLDKSLGRPEKVIKEVIDTTSKDFQIVFSEFKDREGIYGFGDLQIKAIYDKEINRRKIK